MQLDPCSLDSIPTYKKLCQIVEAHVNQIPFENIAQHSGTIDTLQTLQLEKATELVLHRNRGGFCYELNNLLYELLKTHLSYSSTTRIAGTVAFPNINDPNVMEFPNQLKHLFLICRIDSSPTPSTTPEREHGTVNQGLDTDGYNMEDNGNGDAPEHHDCYIIDVAFGEPALHPSKYIFDVEQSTPDGMLSKITKNGDDHDYVTLHWFTNGQWIPRLRWKYSESLMDDPNNTNRSNESFQTNLDYLQSPESVFAQKLICTKVSRAHKYTLAGN
jgi:arylamine N-acetyltransferase